MIHFSLSTVIMCLLTTNLLIVICYTILKSKKLLIAVGYQILGFILVLTVVRFILPYEFPFTYTFWLPEIISKPLTYMLHPRIHIGTYSFSIWQIIIGIWLLGSFFYGIRLIHIHLLMIKRLKCAEKNNDVSSIQMYEKIVDTICKELGKRNNFSILIFQDIQVPMYCYYKRPYIILPCELELSKDEWYFIIRHEMTHHFNHDVIIKYGILLLCIFYWWNPFCHLLKKECNTILEMRVDDNLTKGEEHLKIAYLVCLITIAKKSYRNKVTDMMTISFCGTKPSMIIQRCTLLINDGDEKIKNSNVFHKEVLCILVIIGIFISSYCTLFNASYTPEYLSEEYLIPSEQEIYAIDNGDGTFDLYIRGEYIETVSDLSYYPADILITKKSS